MLFLRCLACVCSEDTVSKKIFHFDICHCGIHEFCQFSVLFFSQVQTVSSFNALCKMSCCTGLQFFLGKVNDLWQSGQSQLFGILVIFKQDGWNSETGHN